MKLSRNELDTASFEYEDDNTDAHAPSIDVIAIVVSALRRWKLIAAVALLAVFATYGVLKAVPTRYRSTVEILVYDPTQQINVALQKTIFPFADSIGNDGMNTEIHVLRSKMLALRVAANLDLANDPEFQPRDLLVDWAEWVGFSSMARALKGGDKSVRGWEDKKAERLDHAADALLDGLQVWQESYVLNVTATSQSATKAQLLTSAIAENYLTSQSEARQAALQRVAMWLKDRLDNLQSRLLENEALIEKLKAENNIRDNQLNDFGGRRIGELNTQLMKAHLEVEEKRARLEQVRSVIDARGDIQSISELTASVTLTALRQKQAELTARLTDLRTRLDESHGQVVALRAELESINQQINTEAKHIFGNIKNSYDIAVRQEQSLATNLQWLTTQVNSESFIRLQQLRRATDADRKLWESYISEYNDISERSTLQGASARMISPASLPRWPSSPKRKLFYLIGGTMGLGGGFLLALLLEYVRRPGVRSETEIERNFGRPVVGIIPLIRDKKVRGRSERSLLNKMVEDPFSPLTSAVQSLRVGLELSSISSKVTLITSALPGEGKSTTAMLLAASSAHSGKRTILVDCDLHQQSTSARPGLSEFLLGRAEASDVITMDAVAKTHVIRAGSAVPNPADLLMTERMRDLIADLRNEFDHIVIDAPPLLPTVDTLVLTTITDRILMIVEWSQTPRLLISEAFKMLRAESHRVAGVVLTKADVSQLPRYGHGRGYGYGRSSSAMNEKSSRQRTPAR